MSDSRKRLLSKELESAKLLYSQKRYHDAKALFLKIQNENPNELFYCAIADIYLKKMKTLSIEEQPLPLEERFELAKQLFYQTPSQSRPLFEKIIKETKPTDDFHTFSKFYLFRLENKSSEAKSSPDTFKYKTMGKKARIPFYYTTLEKNNPGDDFNLEFIRETTRNTLSSAGKTIMSLTGK